MKQLTPDQTAALKAWAEQGTSLSEIQKRLSEEFSLNMTYMDVRFLMDDLNIEIKEKKQASAGSPKEAAPNPASGGTLPEEPEVVGTVSVELDRLTRPGSLVSGSVTFSDGMKSDWYLDEHGRLGLSPSQKDYRPSQEDVQEFQLKLQELLQKQGF